MTETGTLSEAALEPEDRGERLEQATSSGGSRPAPGKEPTFRKGTWWSSHCDLARRFARPLLRGHGLPSHHDDDVAQEACRIAFQASSLPTDGSAQGSWIFRTVLHLVQALRRKVGREEAALERLAWLNDGRRCCGPASRCPETLAACLRLLTPRQREVVELAAEGLTLEEISRKTGLPQATVKQRLMRAEERILRARRPEK